jgi:hypothetical protein
MTEDKLPFELTNGKLSYDSNHQSTSCQSCRGVHTTPRMRIETSALSASFTLDRSHESSQCMENAKDSIWSSLLSRLLLGIIRLSPVRLSRVIRLPSFTDNNNCNLFLMLPSFTEIKPRKIFAIPPFVASTLVENDDSTKIIEAFLLI